MRKQNLIHYTLSKELSVHVTYCRWMWLRSWFTNMLYIHGRIYFPLDDLLNKDLENVKRIECICFGIYGKQNTLKDITTAWFHCLYKILKQEKCENKVAFFQSIYENKMFSETKQDLSLIASSLTWLQANTDSHSSKLLELVKYLS